MISDDLESGAAGAGEIGDVSEQHEKRQADLQQHGQMGRSGEELVNEFSAVFHVNQEEAIEMLAWFDANFASKGGGSEVDMRERDRYWRGLFHGAFDLLLSYCSNQKIRCEQCHMHTHGNDMLLSIRTMALALGFTSVAGGAGSEDLARLFPGVSKQRVDKPLIGFIEKLGLTPLPGQRKKEAREKMSRSRKRQLNPASGGPVVGTSNSEH